MAYITKRGSSYSVRYTYQDEHGKSCDKWESFPTKEEDGKTPEADRACRPGNEGKAPLSSAHLMQKRALIAMQYSALHHRTWITPTVQKPCRNRAAMAYKTKKP